MEIQWVIIARDYRLNDDRTIDIGGIFHYITIRGEDNRASMLEILTKMAFVTGREFTRY